MRNLFKFVLLCMFNIAVLSSAQIYKNDNAEELLTLVKQENKERKKLLYCVTHSCCSLGIYTLQVWSHKECSYIVSSKRIAVLDMKHQNGEVFTGDEIELKEDVLLIDKDGSLKTQDMEAVMEAGTYKVISGQIAFEPTLRKIKIKVVCWVAEHQGNFFGHEYSYTLMACIAYPTIKKVSKEKWINGGYGILDLKNNTALLDLIRQNDNVITFQEDIHLGENHYLKAGTYLVEDGKIYTRSIFIND